MALDLSTVPAPVAAWMEALPSMPLSDVVAEPSAAALISADLVVGFCTEGNLASPRIGALAEPAAALFRRARELGVERFVLLQDTHEADALEFGAFAPHCVRGTREAEAVAALRELPFSDSFVVVRKNSVHPALGTEFEAWLDAQPSLRTAVVIGDCTDICVYQTAMHLRNRANARHIDGFRVIVPADLVDTYDLPVEAARSVGAMPHEGDFFHLVFLYHLALCGVEVVRSLT